MSRYPESGRITDPKGAKSRPLGLPIDRLSGVEFSIEESPFAEHWILTNFPGHPIVLVVPMGKKEEAIRELKAQAILWTFKGAMEDPTE